MTQVPQKPLVPNGTLITKTAEEGRALAVMLARNSIHAMQGELETLKAGRAQYAHDPYGLIAASHVVAVEFATVAAANAYWRSFQCRSLAHVRERRQPQRPRQGARPVRARQRVCSQFASAMSAFGVIADIGPSPRRGRY